MMAESEAAESERRRVRDVVDVDARRRTTTTVTTMMATMIVRMR